MSLRYSERAEIGGFPGWGVALDGRGMRGMNPEAALRLIPRAVGGNCEDGDKESNGRGQRGGGRKKNPPYSGGFPLLRARSLVYAEFTTQTGFHEKADRDAGWRQRPVRGPVSEGGVFGCSITRLALLLVGCCVWVGYFFWWANPTPRSFIMVLGTCSFLLCFSVGIHREEHRNIGLISVAYIWSQNCASFPEPRP